MRYTVETVGGDELELHQTLTEATRAAVSRLEDDPELGTLHVYSFGRMSPMGLPTSEHVKTITFAPDAHWNHQTVVLEPGEKIQPPDDTWKQDSDTALRSLHGLDLSGLSGLDIGDPKHPRHHEVMSDVWDSREKV